MSAAAPAEEASEGGEGEMFEAGDTEGGDRTGQIKMRSCEFREDGFL